MRRDPLQKLRRVVRTAERVLAQLESLEELTIKEVSGFTKMGEEEVRRRFPIIKHGPKTHRIAAQEALKVVRERTVQP